jgi:hypothetical protein
MVRTRPIWSLCIVCLIEGLYCIVLRSGWKLVEGIMSGLGHYSEWEPSIELDYHNKR